jgi:hypothetical protein
MHGQGTSDEDLPEAFLEKHGYGGIFLHQGINPPPMASAEPAEEVEKAMPPVMPPRQ